MSHLQSLQIPFLSLHQRLTTTEGDRHPATHLVSLGLPEFVRDSSKGRQGGRQTEGSRLFSGLPGLDEPVPPLPALPVSKALHSPPFISPFAAGAPGNCPDASLTHVTSHRKACPYEGSAKI